MPGVVVTDCYNNVCETQRFLKANFLSVYYDCSKHLYYP